MWRMGYSIAKNLRVVPRLIRTMHRMTDQPETYSEQDIYDYVRYIVDLMKKAGHIKTECFGADNLPAEGGYVMYPNHLGKYDAYGIVSAHEKPISVVMDREMSYFMFVSEIVDALRGKRMDIHSSRQGLTIINQVAQEVAEGRRYVIFPEGAYDNKKHHNLWDFKPGCFKAATKVQAPVVPVALVNSHKVYNSWTLAPVKTQVHFLQPLYFEDYKELNTYQIAQIVKDRIQDKLMQLGLTQAAVK